MEKSFSKEKLYDQGNISIVKIMMYIAVIMILFGYLERIADFSTMVTSFGGTTIFAQLSLFLTHASRIYWKDGNPF